MRLLIPLLIILLGVVCGYLVCKAFNQTEAMLKPSVIAGGIGAFAGLLLRDALDDTSGGLLSGAVIAAILGAVAVSGIVNLFARFNRR